MRCLVHLVYYLKSFFLLRHTNELFLDYKVCHSLYTSVLSFSCLPININKIAFFFFFFLRSPTIKSGEKKRERERRENQTEQRLSQLIKVHRLSLCLYFNQWVALSLFWPFEFTAHPSHSMKKLQIRVRYSSWDGQSAPFRTTYRVLSAIDSSFSFSFLLLGILFHIHLSIFFSPKSI